ncbi:MAG: stress response translation initiation inhibitor YciH [Candidatus Thermoplasmatota archaeon]|jgi:translation initiation factor 1|nr:stress response translation initiation inhibitor YciH [Candidatus Thermoplasmatota archaeon]MCL5963000.1 stress response translation initiation inhibitor YciH [Candidatus Thermoplasmatota archaeon]
MTKICPVCGLPDEICICEDIAKESQTIRVYEDKRRYGKMVTIIDGMNVNDINVHELAKKLKSKCATGGTVKDGKIELQGDQKQKVVEVLEEMGYKVKML